MARNCEKAQAILNRFLQMKKDNFDHKKEERRPYIAAKCKTLGDADHWRFQIIKEIKKRVTEIQNGAMGEHKIRDLNDEINRLMREKHHWDIRIRELGGADHTRERPMDADGRKVIGSGGYMYFGAARNLPGVRELLEKRQIKHTHRKTRKELYANVEADYYGYGPRDDIDTLIADEEKVEKRLYKELVEKYGEEKESDIYNNNKRSRIQKQISSFPSKSELESILLEKKKQALLKSLNKDIT